MADHRPFWSLVDHTPDCWIWTAGGTGNGYGGRRTGKGNDRAHRVAWMLMFGPIPDGLFVCHRCDNPLCVRPDHLFLGTHEDNMADRQSKGRQARYWLGKTKSPEARANIRAGALRRYARARGEA